MKTILYTFRGNSKKMSWNEANEEIAKREADNGDYTIVDVASAPEQEA